LPRRARKTAEAVTGYQRVRDIDEALRISYFIPQNIDGMPAASTRRVFRVCEWLRSKTMWTLTHPKNRPCGYPSETDIVRGDRHVSNVHLG